MGHLWITLTKGQYCTDKKFALLLAEHAVEQTVELPYIWDAMTNSTSNQGISNHGIALIILD